MVDMMLIGDHCSTIVSICCMSSGVAGLDEDFCPSLYGWLREQLCRSSVTADMKSKGVAQEVVNMKRRLSY
jgi:hypothetical protein